MCATFTIPRPKIKQNKEKESSRNEQEGDAIKEKRQEEAFGSMRKYLRNLIMSFSGESRNGGGERVGELIRRKKPKTTSTNNRNIQMNFNKMLIQYLVFKSQ